MTGRMRITQVNYLLLRNADAEIRIGEATVDGAGISQRS
jgi:hypothetical protein